MNKKEIEKNDARLIGKIREIISHKEKQKEKKKPSIWENSGFRLIFLFTGLIAASLIAAGLMVFQQQTAPIASVDLDTAGQTQPTVSTVKTVAKSPPLFSPKNIGTENKALAQPTVMESQQTLLEKDRHGESGAADLSRTVQNAEKPPDVQIYQMLSCCSVMDRQYVSPKTRFSLKEDPTPFVWMTVLTDHPPFTLTHVYYLNGHRYCDVPLAIRHPHMRTWSNVSLNVPDHAGQWRVEVITGNGVKLDQIEFTVVE